MAIRRFAYTWGLRTLGFRFRFVFVVRPAAITAGDTFRSSTGMHLWRAGAIEIREQDEYKHNNDEHEGS